MKTEIRTITPEMAKQMLTRNQRNRKLNQSHVNFLSSEMTKGNWVFDGQPIRFNEGGRLLDGQHRLSAIVQSGIPNEFLVITGIGSEAFKVMDTGRVRNNSDALGLAGYDYTASISAAYRVILANREKKNVKSVSRISNSDVIDFCEKNPKLPELCKQTHAIYQTSKKILNQSIITGMKFLTDERNIVESDYFWEKFATGANLSEGHPILALREKLIQDKFNREKISPNDKIKLVSTAWNKYRKNQTVNFYRINKEDKHVELI